ncbi:hypothetical protein CMV_022889 [Castanea mollissima]|uniref:Uncharacterized protein n=1 Tax=Castanea mollissima TaxID=60419 RepID=A0A8J4VE02_9ROSI|nr:hypothetical protein CMV_022889 [Castanea mollissima]
MLLRDFTREEVEIAIKQMKPITAPSLDVNLLKDNVTVEDFSLGATLWILLDLIESFLVRAEMKNIMQAIHHLGLDYLMEKFHA